MSAEHKPVADDLTVRLRAVAYGTTFLDVRADILALIERDDRNRMDGIAACELLAVSRARCAVLLEALRGAIGALEFSQDYHRDLGNEEQAFAADKLDAARKAISLATGESK